VRLPRPKLFAAAILREDNDIGWSGEEKIWERREIGMNHRAS
jgi:hypothetical protein